MPQTPMFMTTRDLMQLLGIASRQTIYRQLRGDPTFPRPRRVARCRGLAWVRREVEAYVEQLPTAH